MGTKLLQHPDINWDSKDRLYWKELFKHVRAYGIDAWPPGKGAVWQLKIKRYYYRLPKPKHTMSSPVNDYGSLVGKRINKWFKKNTKGLDCLDNFRWARKSKQHEVRRYIKARNNGCCGSCDKEIKILFRTYLVGFNFGH